MTAYHLITRSRSCKYVEKHTKVGPRITEKRKGTTRIKCHLRFSQATDRCTFFCSIFLIGTKQCSFSAAYLSIGYFQVNKLRHEASAESNLFTARELSPMTRKRNCRRTELRERNLVCLLFHSQTTDTWLQHCKELIRKHHTCIIYSLPQFTLPYIDIL